MKNNIKDDIMSIINDDEVGKKSKFGLYFINYVRILLLIVIGIVATFFVSLLGMISHIPFEILAIITAVCIIIYLLISNEDKIKLTPKLYVWSIILLILLSFGFVLNMLQMHKKIISMSGRGGMMHKMYNHYEPNMYERWHDLK